MASVLESIRDYFITCPHLDSTRLLNVYKVLSEPVNYSIDPITSPLLIYEDVVGNRKKQFRFYLTVVEHCDTLEKEFAIQEFLENIVAWIQEQEDARNYPTLLGDKIQVLQVPELFNKDQGLSTGIYQVLINYEYIEEV